jgi:hypothetical protein
MEARMQCDREKPALAAVRDDAIGDVQKRFRAKAAALNKPDASGALDDQEAIGVTVISSTSHRNTYYAARGIAQAT